MRRGFAGLAVLFVSAICLAVPAFAKYIVETERIDTTQETVRPTGDNVHAVTFLNADGSQNCIKYFDDGYELSLKDTPFTSTVSGNELTVYYWKADQSNAVLNNHITLNGDLTIRPYAANKTSLLGNYYEEMSSGNSMVVNSGPNTNLGWSTGHNGDSSGRDYNINLDNYFSLSNNTYWLDSVHENGTYDFWEVGMWHTDHITAYDSTTKFNVKGDNGEHGADSPTLVNSYGSPKTYGVARRDNSYLDLGGYTRSNSSIGLETHPADYPNGQEKYNEYYKPINLEDAGYGSTVDPKKVSENCATRIVLNCDLVYTGQMTLGGLTGFAKQDTADELLNWTQLNYQGFIIGPYTEIDLNGFDLIVEGNMTEWKNSGKTNSYSVVQKGMLDSFGSITDSSSKRTGHVLLRSGSKLYTPMVMEDMYREDAIPEIYADGTDYFNMYRCPYLDCSVIFEPGCKFYGKMYVSFGNTMGTVNTDVLLVGGVGSGALMELSSGRIERSTYYNTELYEQVKATDKDDDWTNPTLKNIAYQRFRYTFDHAVVNIGSFDASVTIEGKLIDLFPFSFTFKFSSKKHHKTVPPYFDFYSYGSDITISQTFFFMNGCTLYGDSSTVLRFRYGQFDVGSTDLNYLSDNKNYYSGGLNLATSYYPFSDNFNSNASSILSTGWADTRKTFENGNDGLGAKVYIWNDFWNYYKNKPAHMIFNGEFDFQSGNPVPYTLGGFIDFVDNDSFLDTIKGVSINLFGSTALSTVCMTDMTKINHTMAGSLGQKRRAFAAAGFYNAPLISNGEILTPLEGAGIYPGRSGSSITSAYYKIDERLIYINGKSTEAYAFMFNSDGPSNNVNWANNTTLTSDPNSNSLSGSFRKVAVTQQATGSKVYSSRIAYNGQTYINYHGAFLRYDVDTNTCSLMKLVGQTAKKASEDTSDADRDVYRVMENNADGTWAISSVGSKF